MEPTSDNNTDDTRGSGVSPVRGEPISGTVDAPLRGESSRDTLLRRVRDAVHRGRHHRVKVPQDIPPDIGYLGVEGDPAQRLFDELEAVGAHAYRVAGPDDVAPILRELIDRFSVRCALCWEHDLLERCNVAAVLGECNVRMVGSATGDEAQRREDVFIADLGISSVDWAVAETGTLALCASPVHLPTVSLVPPVHLAIVGASQIVPDLFDVFAKLEERGLPSNLSLITGPSKTGDIELKLTTGVHGPGEVHVVIVAKE